MQQFVIIGGLPGSGKSTYAQRLKSEQGFYVVSSDMIRVALNSGTYPRGDSNGQYATLDPIVWALAEHAVRMLLRADKCVAVDAMNLTPARRDFWRQIALSESPTAVVSCVWCTGSWDSPERWASERGHSSAEYHAIRTALDATVQPPTEAESLPYTTHPPHTSDTQ